MQAAQIATDAVEQDLLLVSGSIGSSGVRLAPVQALRGVEKPESGAYTLRLTTRDGRSFTHAFTADLVDHAGAPRATVCGGRTGSRACRSRASRFCTERRRSPRTRRVLRPSAPRA